MQLPVYTNPTPDCYLTVDKNNNTIMLGDVLQYVAAKFNGKPHWLMKYEVVEHNGNLVAPTEDRWLLNSFVINNCEIIKDK